jgi:hypothetical protein
VFKYQEKLLQPVSGRRKGIPVVPRIGVYADVPKDVQTVLHPFTDGDLMAVEYRAGNGCKGLSAAFAAVSLNPVPALTKSADTVMLAVWASLRNDRID